MRDANPLEGWLAAAPAVFVLAVVLLGWVIRSLVRTLRASVVASLPVLVEQPLRLPDAGTYDLYIEGIRFSTDFARLEFALFDPTHVPVKLRPTVFRTLVSGLKRVRLKLRSFDAAAAGTYTLRLSGIKPDQDPANRILLARPVAGTMVLHIVAIVALSVLAMGAAGIALFVMPG